MLSSSLSKRYQWELKCSIYRVNFDKGEVFNRIFDKLFIYYQLGSKASLASNANSFGSSHSWNTTHYLFDVIDLASAGQTVPEILIAFLVQINNYAEDG